MLICKCGKGGCTEIMFHPVMPGSTTPCHSNGSIYYADTMQSHFLIYNTIHYTLKVNTTTHTHPRLHTLHTHIKMVLTGSYTHTRTPTHPTHPTHPMQHTHARTCPHACFCYSMRYVGTSNFLKLKRNVYTFNLILPFL